MSNDNSLLRKGGQDIAFVVIRQGDIIARFSQIYQGTQKVTILADNSLYINPFK
ncbi:MAG: hypothetical protein N2169_05625 [bacterium]|nr:hypothetical protein [bacterium]